MMKKRGTIILIVFLLFNTIIFAQAEYFVQINPTTCNYTIIDSIPTIQWVALSQSSFDKINKRFIFRGQDASSDWFLCSVNATNGNLISNPQFPTGGNQFGDIRFDNASGILYGLNWVGTSSNVNFISINPTNFNYTIINTIHNISGLSNDATIDEINHRIIFTADDSSGNHCLFSVDVLTGNVISKPLFPNPNIMGYFVFDNSSGNLYGLRWSSTPNASVFVSINPANSNYTIIGTIPYDLSGGIPMGYATFDEINKRYTFCGMDASSNKYLYTIDATNGHVITYPKFPTFITPCNLLETRYDNSSGNLYALHWGSHACDCPSGSPTINIPDVTTCNTITTDTLNAGPGYATYQWSNGDTTQITTVNSTGNYWIKVTNNHKCLATDTVKVIISTPPVVDVLHDTSVCNISSIFFNAFYPNTNAYLWSDGFTSPLHSISSSGNYWVNYTFNNLCFARDSFYLNMIKKPLDISLPNIVTPNNDGINDYIDFTNFQFSSFQLKIYNRWGTEVFESTNPNCIWKPTEDDGTYFYTAQYQINCNNEAQSKSLKGFITVIR